MADIDAPILGAEFKVLEMMALQILLLLLAVALGFSAGRSPLLRWFFAAFIASLILASVVCGAAQYRCAAGTEEIEGRIHGRTEGPYLDIDKAENNLDWLKYRSRESYGIAAGTIALGSLFFFGARLGRAKFSK